MIPANGLIKLSALFLYRRLFIVHTRSSFNAISLVICALWTGGFFIATVFGCGRNFTYPWKPLIYIASCNTNARLDGLMVSDLITDILVWLLPMPIVSSSWSRWADQLVNPLWKDLETQLATVTQIQRHRNLFVGRSASMKPLWYVMY